ncbi:MULTISPECIES: hypothetical protein [unclassified Prochlorococcus]|uniref:hypothetical protein n=1 Tax=unclassified Prochlorococcus TaxID=2627481 RepID=UPI00097CCCF8|nr:MULTISPECIES: hypothetical protein [unclassified Prochlorococcus]AQL29800.1 hypothetical protein BSR22_00780 [Prochlorococcus sp. RS50]AQL31570.1 hypothetical protein BS620_00695 [Prochlorococcus sp. RS01]AQL34522.1 hypothetical protein BS621_07015 [Prochlorococcus sp. RS04]
MKIAVCLFGLTGGSKGSNGEGRELNLNKSYKNYKKMIFKDLDIDFFAHSWSVNMKEKIINTYKPKSIFVEQQLDFSNISLKDYKIQNHKSYKAIFDKYSKQGGIEKLKRLILQTHSRWLSVKKSIGLMKEYKEKFDVNYDFVIQLRYDLFFTKKIDLTPDLINKFICIPRAFDNYESLHDFLFISSYEQAIKFSSLYDQILNYSIRSPFASLEHLNYLNIKPFYYIDINDVKPLRYYLKQSILSKIKMFIKRKIGEFRVYLKSFYSKVFS